VLLRRGGEAIKLLLGNLKVDSAQAVDLISEPGTISVSGCIRTVDRIVIPGADFVLPGSARTIRLGGRARCFPAGPPLLQAHPNLTAQLVATPLKLNRLAQPELLLGPIERG
jgi:hypothetical protein